jgi:thioredoxin reductase
MMLHERDTADATFDVAIVGAGIAGLSASLFLARAGRSIVVFDAGNQRILSVDRVREFLGFDGWEPARMLAHGREEARRYGAQWRAQAVDSILPRLDGTFDVLARGDLIRARTVVLATGLIDKLPDLSGVPPRWGNALRVCPCFDGNEVRDQRFVVFGIGDRIAHASVWASAWSPHVTAVSTHVMTPAEEERLRLLDIPVVRDEVRGLVHADGRLVAVSTRQGATIECDATFVALEYEARSDLAFSLCEVDSRGLVKTDADGRTSRPGLFAIGNATSAGAFHHLAHAAASGTHVGPIVNSYLLEAKVAELRAKVAH